uniref:Sulfotransferase domain protein n=1 Tax=mine drainage metagenome TaxID=410659 RepID=E6QWM4_9ZZZZ
MSVSGFLAQRVFFGVPILRLRVAADFLWRNRHRIEPGYAGRVAFVMTASLFGAAFAPIDRYAFGRAPDRLDWDGPILFILGYWRSGTTFLHELIAQDPQFVTPSLLDANVAPCLSVGRALAPLVAPFLPGDRGYDAMSLDLAGPWEEEGMLFSLTGTSPYQAAAFPQDFRDFDAMLDMRGLSETVIRRWQQAYVTICHRLTRGSGQTLLFKSPPAAARLPLLLKIFPQARFLHLSRDPETVFASNMLMMRTVGEKMRLQRETEDDIAEHVLHRFEYIYDRYTADAGGLPPRRLAELTYERLVTDPLGELEKAYQALDLPGFDVARPAFAGLLAARKDYRPNAHPALSPQRQAEIASRWGPYAKRWGYYRAASSAEASA